MRIGYWYRAASPGPIVPAPRRVIGLDAFSKGWVAVELRDGTFAKAGTAAGLADLVASIPGALVYGVDMPIGFAPVGGRAADEEARKFVGPRSSSVFPTPPRAALASSKLAYLDVAESWSRGNRPRIDREGAGGRSPGWAAAAPQGTGSRWRNVVR